MMNDCTYFFTDIEADGPIPGSYSMISFASVATDSSGKVLDEFEVNLLPLEGASQHPDTMQWWSTQQEAWEYCTSNPRDPAEAISEYSRWIGDHPGVPVFVAHPVHFDHMWVNWYLVNFTGKRAFHGPSIDIETYAMATFGCSILECNRRSWPERWLKGYQHTHKAIDDARGYAQAFCEIASYNQLLNRDGLPRTPENADEQQL